MLFRSDRKSTRLNSSHTIISYAVFCLKKKTACRWLRVESGVASYTHLSTPAGWWGGGRRPNRRLPPRQDGGGDRAGLPLLFFNDTATTEIYTLSLHDALPI